MKHNEHRHITFTRKIIEIESELRESFTEKKENDLLDKCKAIKNIIDTFPSILTNNELDYFLQITMMYLTTRLNWEFKDEIEMDGTNFRATIALYNYENDLLLIKPCYYFPGICSVRHPTIPLRNKDFRWKNIWNGKIGLTGVSICTEQVIFSNELNNENIHEHCQYVNLESLDKTNNPNEEDRDKNKITTSLCVPLGENIESVLATFYAEVQRYSADKGDQNQPYCICPISKDNQRCDPDQIKILKRKTSQIKRYAVLNIESKQKLKAEKCIEFLFDKEIYQLMRTISNRFIEREKERHKYKVMRSCANLFNLSQHNMNPRQSFRSLLKIVSDICDGADVTLHLKDLWGSEELNKNRCLKLVAGVGKNFRGFLTNERYGIEKGLVGKTHEESGLKILTARDIAREIRSNRPGAYKQLMPNTYVNVGVPIKYHDTVLGVINIEWDFETYKKTSGWQKNEGVKKYIDKKEALLERIADYFSIVIDYFNDLGNERLNDSSEIKLFRQYKERERSHKLLMSYYMEDALKNIDSNQYSDDLSSNIFKRIIDAVGYAITSQPFFMEKNFKFLASIRDIIKENKDNTLKLLVYHGPSLIEDKNAHVNISTKEFKTVLGTAFSLGYPIFGSIETSEKGSILKCDPICKDLAPKHLKEYLERGDSVKYYTSGTKKALYEFAAPLIVGNDSYGTFDLELYNLLENTESEEFPLKIKPNTIRLFLEWSRAIAFCMACIEDKKELKPQDHERNEWTRFVEFKNLVAQIIANVTMPPESLFGIAMDYLQDLIPVENVVSAPSNWEKSQKDITIYPQFSGNDEKIKKNFNKLVDDKLLKKNKPSTKSGESNSNQYLSVLDYTGEILGLLGVFGANFNEMNHAGKGQYDHSFCNVLNTGVGELVSSFFASFASSVIRYRKVRKFEDDFDYLEILLSYVLEIFKKDINNSSKDKINFFACLHEALEKAIESLGQFDEGLSNKRIKSNEVRYGWFLYFVDDNKNVHWLRCGENRKRWGCLRTSQMYEFVEKLGKLKHPAEAFSSRLDKRLEIINDHKANNPKYKKSRDDFTDEERKELIGDLKRELGNGQAGERDIKEIIYKYAIKVLGRTKYKFDGTNVSSPTQCVALSGEIRAFLNWNTCPYEQKQINHWLFQDRPYSVIAIPFQKRNESNEFITVGVLELLKEMDKEENLDFFKIKDLEASEMFKKEIEILIQAHVL